MNRRLRVAAVLALGLAVSGAASTATVPLPVLEAIQGRPVGWAPTGPDWFVDYLKAGEGSVWIRGCDLRWRAFPPRRRRRTSQPIVRIGRSNVRQTSWPGFRAGRFSDADIGRRIHALDNAVDRSAGLHHRVRRQGFRLLASFGGIESCSGAASSGWLENPGRSPHGEMLDVYRFSGGRYRLIARR